jgi:hypothetical protein
VAALVALVGSPALAQPRPAPPAVSGGNGLLYIGTYKGEIQIFDEATEKQVGAIALKTGIPRSLVPSQDRQRFYVLDASLEKIEVVDIAARTTLDRFTLSSGTTKTRVRSMAPDPLNRFVILLTRSATKQRDRWEIGPSTLQLYDFAQKKVTRTLDWPQGEERESADLRFSPDGKLLYFFGDDVLVYETTNFTKVDEWQLSHPQEPGLGRVTFGSIDDLYDQPGYFTGLFTMQDPVQNRRMMGIGRVDLNARKVDFSPLGPAQPLTFAQAPDRKRGYAIFQDIPSSATSSGASTSSRSASSIAPSSRGGRASTCASAATASCSTCSSPAPPSTSTTPTATSTCARSR